MSCLDRDLYGLSVIICNSTLLHSMYLNTPSNEISIIFDVALKNPSFHFINAAFWMSSTSVWGILYQWKKILSPIEEYIYTYINIIWRGMKYCLHSYQCPHFPTNLTESSVLRQASISFESRSWPLRGFWVASIGCNNSNVAFVHSLHWYWHVIDDVHVPNSLGSRHREHEQLKYHCSWSFLYLSILPIKN